MVRSSYDRNDGQVRWSNVAVGRSWSIHYGWDAVDSLGDRLDDLHAATAAPVMARRTWLRACARHLTDRDPVAVVVAGAAGEIDGVALLGVRSRVGVKEYVALGHGPSDAAALPARTPAAARALAEAVAAFVRAAGGPWRLTLRHLPEADPVVVQLAQLLPYARREGDEVSPRLLLDPTKSTLRDYTSKQYVKNRRRRVEKLSAQGTPVVLDVVRTSGEIAQTLPEIVRICRKRDREMDRTSIVDAPAAGRFFHDVVMDHAERGEILLLTAHVDAQLAGYALCLLDGDVIRVWNCRFDPRWADFGMGQICRSALIELAIADGLHSVDWLLGDEPYKAGLSNDRVPAEDLFASSNLLLAMVTSVGLRVRNEARGATADDASPPAWVRITRKVGRPLLGS